MTVGDSTITDRFYGFEAATAIKEPCRVASSAAVPFVGSAPYGYKTIDGVAVTDNASASGAQPDRVLLTAQADQTTNGVWIVRSTAWQRAPDYDGARNLVRGTQVYVGPEGSANGNTIWTLTTTDNPIIVGTSKLTFSTTGLDPTNPSPLVVYAETFGAKEDGHTDDTAALQAAIAYFSPNGVPIRSGTIVINGRCKISKPLLISGTPSYSVVFKGAYTGPDPTLPAPCIVWSGATGFSSMVIMYGCNRSGFDGVNFDAGAGNIESCVEIMSDRAYAPAHVTSAFAAGLAVVAPISSTSGMIIGTSLAFGIGTSHFEVVRVTAVSAGVSITANFQFPHATNEQVASNFGSSATFIKNSVMEVAVGATSVGIRYGNATNGGTSQVSESHFENVSAIPSSGVIADAYSLFRAFGSGNVANVRFLDCASVGMQYGFDVTGVRSVVEFHKCGGGATGTAEILSAGREMVNGHETESVDTPCRFVIAVHGGAPTQLTIMNCNVTILLPSDDIGLMGGGSTVLVCNNFTNQRLSSTTSFKVSSVGLFAGNSADSSYIFSCNNFYGAGHQLSPIFYDGSGNPMGPYQYPLVSGGVPNVTSIGDYLLGGQLHPMYGQATVLMAGAMIDFMDAGQTVNYVGRQDGGWNSVTIPYTAFQVAALTKTLTSLWVPPNMMVTKCFASVTVPFAGPAGTLQLKAGITSGGNELLVAFDVKSATILRGLADGDLGAGLARASAVQGGAIASGAAVTSLFPTLTSSSGNLSSLSAGSVRISFKTERFG